MKFHITFCSPAFFLSSNDTKRCVKFLYSPLLSSITISNIQKITLKLILQIEVMKSYQMFYNDYLCYKECEGYFMWQKWWKVKVQGVVEYPVYHFQAHKKPTQFLQHKSKIQKLSTQEYIARGKLLNNVFVQNCSSFRWKSSNRIVVF